MRFVNSKGLSLLEILLAMIILCVGLLSSLSLFHSGLKANIRTSALNKLQFFAQEKMENIKKEGYGALESGESDFQYGGAPYEDIQYKISVTDPSLTGETPEFKLKMVALTVKGYDGQQLTEKKFICYIAE